MTIQTIKTACRRNCYSTCSMLAYVENGKLIKVTGNPENKATRGTLCLKGLSYVQRVYSPHRIVHPLRRKGPRGNGKWEKISWDEALNSIASKLKRIKKEFGEQAVLFYFASGTKGILNQFSTAFWRMYGGYTGTYGDLCWPAGLEAVRLTFGENKHSAPWDILNSKLILLWGKNPADTNIHQMSFIMDAQEKGTTVIVIDPVKTSTALKSDIHIPINPGTDAALANAVARHLIEHELYDKTFIENYVYGFDEYRSMVMDYTYEKAEKITGVPAQTIIDLAELYGKTKPASISYGYGPQRYTNAGQSVRAVACLQALTGNLGKSGGDFYYANLQTDKIPPIDMPKEPDNVRISIPIAQLGEGIVTTDNPPVKMLWVERGNPVTSNPNTHKTIKALNTLDFIVVVDQFHTDTARYADIILPAKTMFEQTDIIGAYWHSYLQLKSKAIEPPGECKPETEIYRELAKRIDLDSSFFPENEEEFLKKYLKKIPEITWEMLEKGPVSVPWSQEIAWSDYVFPTPSGKIEFYSEQAQKLWNINPLPVYHVSAEQRDSQPELARKYPLNLMTAHSKDKIHSQFNNLDYISEINPEPKAEINIYDALDRNIEEGDFVRVFNDRGELTLKAHVTHRIKRGVLNIQEGWWIHEGGTVDFLSADRLTDIGNGAAFHDCLVQVEKVQ